MISDEFVLQLRAVFQAQHHLLRRMRTDLDEVARVLSEGESQRQQIAELEQLLTQIESDSGLLEASDFDDFDVDGVLRQYEDRTHAVTQELHAIGFTNWKDFVKQCAAYDLAHGLDPLAPYEALLTDADRACLCAETYEAQYRWDKWDYIFVGASGVLAALTDYLLVRIPKTLHAGEYPGQQGSPLTAWIKRYDTRAQAGQTDWFAEWARALEDRCKVPYDAMSFVGTKGVERIAGMYPDSHRFQSLGHDPVLGFIFGVLDILRGTITGFSYEHLTQTHTFVHGAVWSNLQPVGLIEAILRHLGHLVSDIATPMGLPAPLMTLFQDLNAGHFGKKGRTVGELSRWMYLNGYDFRHFLVSGITPAVIEIVLRAYCMMRHYAEYGETKWALGSHPKYRSMLLMAHGVAVAGNVGKVVLAQGNPLAINYAEWIAFFRYLFPSVKYWVFDRTRLKWEHLEQINEKGWRQIEDRGAEVLSLIAAKDFSLIDLGHSSLHPARSYSG